MKSNEYMIGDWVFDKDTQKNYQIAGLSSNKVRLHTESYTPFKRTSQVSPILLNIIYLIRMGLKKVEEGLYINTYELNGDCDSYKITVSHNRIEDKCRILSVRGPLVDMPDCHFSYVHELQHALKISGIDKSDPELMKKLNKALE